MDQAAELKAKATSKLENLSCSSLSSLIRMHRAIIGGEAATSSSSGSVTTAEGSAEQRRLSSRKNSGLMETQELQLDEDELRREVSRGVEQARQFEQQFNAAVAAATATTTTTTTTTTVAATLPTTTCSSLIADAATVMGTFISIIKLLNRGGDARMASAAATVARTTTSSPPPPLKASPGVAATPPQSPRSSPAMTPATTPDGSPGVAATSPAAAAATEDPAFDFSDPRVPLSRKRKHQPRRVEKVRASSNESGTEQPPEDGYTWRKYGQKDILNSRHPKSYYRCSLQKEMGCPAVKYVQKSEDDPGHFLVTYIADHTCRQRQQQQQQHQLGMWSAASRLPTAAASTCCAALSLTSAGGIEISLPSSFSSRLEDVTKARLALSSTPVRAISSPTMLIRPNPISPLTTPRFGPSPGGSIIKAEPLFASGTTFVSTSCVSNTSTSLGLKEERALKMEEAGDYELQQKLTEVVPVDEDRNTDARPNEEIWPSLEDLTQPAYFEDHDPMMF